MLLSDFLGSLAHPLAVIAGAGVSIDKPAGLPSAKELVRSTVAGQMGGIIPPEDLEHIFERTSDFPTRPGEFLRFEVAMSYLDSDSRVDVLRQLHQGSPNSNHYLLASLISHGHIIITTNFDLHIEAAFNNLYKVRCPTIIDESGFENASVEASRGVLWKIHGCLSKPATLAATFTAVMANNSERARWLVRIIESCDLVVVGYSGSDDLDIVSLLARTISPRRLLWVQHQASGEPELIQPEEWLASSSARMHLDTVGLDRIMFSSRSPSAATRLHGRVAVLRAPTTEVLSATSRSLGITTAVVPVDAPGASQLSPVATGSIDELTAAANVMHLLAHRRGERAERGWAAASRVFVEHGLKGDHLANLGLLVEAHNDQRVRNEIATFAVGGAWSGVAAGDVDAFLLELHRIEPHLDAQGLVLLQRLRGCLFGKERGNTAQECFESSLEMARYLDDPVEELATLLSYGNHLYPSHFSMFWYQGRPFAYTHRITELARLVGFLPLHDQYRLIRASDYAEKLALFGLPFISEYTSTSLFEVAWDASNARRRAVDLGDVLGELEATYVLAELNLAVAIHYDAVPPPIKLIFMGHWVEWQRVKLLAEGLELEGFMGDRLTEMTRHPSPPGALGVEELRASMFSLQR